MYILSFYIKDLGSRGALYIHAIIVPVAISKIYFSYSNVRRSLLAPVIVAFMSVNYWNNPYPEAFYPYFSVFSKDDIGNSPRWAPNPYLPKDD
jgi:hypothetical protein